MKQIREGSAFINVGNFEKISKEMEVFYNPAMRSNRDISLLFIKAYNILQKDFINKIILPFSASGVRGIRMMKELGSEVVFNDLSPFAVKTIKENLKLNSLSADVKNMGCDNFVMQSYGFDYVDIDPFGSPNPFLDQIIKRAKHNSIIAVTATDLSGLAGTHPKACARKYWSKPLRNEFMHEAGLRILIRKVQLIGAQYERALIPQLSYYKDHYYRIFFKVLKSKSKVDLILRDHKFVDFNEKKRSFSVGTGNYGPMYTGKLQNQNVIEIISKMLENAVVDDHQNLIEGIIIKNSTKRFLDMLVNEFDVFGLYDLHFLKKYNIIATLPSMSQIVSDFCKRTVFDLTGVKTTLPYNDFIKYLNSI